MQGRDSHLLAGPVCRGVLPDSRTGRRYAWAAASVLSHVAILVAACLMVAPVWRHPDQPVRLALVFAPPAPSVTSLASAALPAPAATPPALLRDLAPVRVRATAPQSAFNPARQPKPSAAVPPPAGHPAASALPSMPDASPSAPSLSASPAAGPSLAGPTPNEVAGFTAEISRAVQDAAVMPEAARRMRRQGRAQVSFDYLDGGVAGIILAQSSESALLDGAALQAVRAARYPSPPPALRGHRLALQVWVRFILAAANPG